MGKVLSIAKLTSFVKKIKKIGAKTVLVGGCFDILHPGHIIFLEKAKKVGDILVLLLESDQKVKKLKGQKRPIHTQIDRAKILSELKSVDFVILLPNIEKEADYDHIISQIKPDFIAATSRDPNAHHLERVAKITSAKLKFVTKRVGNYSSSNILQS